MIEAIQVPAPQPGALATPFAEVSRRHGDYAITACAAVADGQGVMRWQWAAWPTYPMARELALLDGEQRLG